MTDVADRLLKDAQLLRAKVETAGIDANLLVTGAVELLNEVSSSKVTGKRSVIPIRICMILWRMWREHRRSMSC